MRWVELFLAFDVQHPHHQTVHIRATCIKTSEQERERDKTEGGKMREPQIIALELSKRVVVV